MKLLLRFSIAVLLCSTVFAQAEIYIVTPSPKEAWKIAKGKKIVVEPIQAIELGRFKKEFESRYGGEEGFRKTFMDFLTEGFGKSASLSSPDELKLELISLGFKEEFVAGHYVMAGSRQAWMGPFWAIRWKIRFRLLQGGTEKLKGVVDGGWDGYWENAPHEGILAYRYEYNPPGRLRLSKGLEYAQEHLVEFVTGRLSASHVQAGEDMKP